MAGQTVTMGDAAQMTQPANAEVLAVEGAQLDAAGTRTAKLWLRVSPVRNFVPLERSSVRVPGR